MKIGLTGLPTGGETDLFYLLDTVQKPLGKTRKPARFFPVPGFKKTPPNGPPYLTLGGGFGPRKNGKFKTPPGNLFWEKKGGV